MVVRNGWLDGCGVATAKLSCARRRGVDAARLVTSHFNLDVHKSTLSSHFPSRVTLGL